MFLACSGLVKEVEWVKYSSAEGRRPSWGGPWDDWGLERGEGVEDMDAERECRDCPLLLKSNPVLDSTAAIRNAKKKKMGKKESEGEFEFEL